jgi:hypothetical protein
VPLLAAAADNRAKVRARSMRCLAMVGQRLVARGPAGQREIKSIVEAATKALSDANPDVRQSARLVAAVLGRAAGEGALDCPLAPKLQSSIPAGLDVSTFDAFDPEALHRCTELSRTTASSGTRLLTRPAAASTVAKSSGNPRG